MENTAFDWFTMYFFLRLKLGSGVIRFSRRRNDQEDKGPKFMVSITVSATTLRSVTRCKSCNRSGTCSAVRLVISSGPQFCCGISFQSEALESVIQIPSFSE